MFKKSAAPSAGGGYTISKSLRFRNSASAYMNRTPGSAATSNTTFTYSAWVKRGQLVSSGLRVLFSANNGTNQDGIQYWNDRIDVFFSNGSSYRLTTTAVYRDPSSWYHVFVSVDTTQSTASNRVKIYINGVQITAFDNANYPTQNYTFIGFNKQSVPNYVGDDTNASGSYFDGYMADVYMIDGQALSPTSFGSTNATTGVWQPIAYTGTYGTNGFYLKFTNTSSTATLGNDSSGNGNTWTTNNFSLTAGSTYDSMTDVPTLTSASVANYPTFNPLAILGVVATQTNGNLVANGNGSNYCAALSTIGMSSGKYYFEATVTGYSGSSDQIGVLLSDASKIVSGVANPWYYSTDYAFLGNGNKYNNNASGGSAGAFTFGLNDVVGVAFDATGGTLQVNKNGGSFTTIYSGIPAGTYFFGTSTYSGSDVIAANFGQQGFKYTPPSGYVGLNTYNLSNSTIVAGNKYMDATLYTGNGSILTVNNAGSFQPDLVWGKDRSSAISSNLYDSVRGSKAQLSSNLSNAEVTRAGNAVVFLSNGFTLDAAYNNINNNTDSEVAWQWQAGSGVSSSNTDGFITSTVSKSTTAGFSIVTYTGNGSATTVGHGLGVAPQFIAIKDRSNSYSWRNYHISTGNTGYVYFNSQDGFTASSTTFNNTTPTSSVFTIGTEVNVNANGDTYVAYCWTAVPGFSAFGSYAGNGSTDGPFVYTGFRPKFLLIKNTGTIGGYGDWSMLDTSRNTYNVANSQLRANTTDSENTNTAYNTDILSNGFKLRTSYNDFNASGYTYIYAAFAENPFKNALAR